MKKQNGITLIALVITIIVMLILVGVSVTVALNGGLFTTAKDAANETKTERDKELALSNGEVEFTINGKTYNSIDEYTQKANTTEIKFYVNDVEYTANSGMTWRDFIQSEYCPDEVFRLFNGTDTDVVIGGRDYSGFSDDTQIFIVLGAMNILGPENRTIELGDEIVESFRYLDADHIS